MRVRLAGARLKGFIRRWWAPRLLGPWPTTKLNIVRVGPGGHTLSFADAVELTAEGGIIVLLPGHRE